ncbi:flagellar biosynthetic protein FliR [Methylopila jiangsuensis]|uniref:Flagellar biosynthetic protein FliR n=1 Tax=Methylopila jiangsuensis TaxID=586230 RepID=A0A9W6JEW9_9HYPH|nr:flagellar biosynthetic protein FliR [Methylopila jiangsuensis]MDR6284148.1 flagellar biosynthetic protein FliR [Methylopila jiangsuensis]GLK76335.1 flagellar biosynthetic protein FliR [Methylopila jiangsuensis]
MRIEFLPTDVAAFVFIFARVGAMVMLMPALGEENVSARFRLTIALLLALVFWPFARPLYALDAMQPIGLLGLLLGEIAVGLTLGVVARLVMSALSTAGFVIANQLGLGFVTTVDPTQGQQGALIGTFLTLVGVALIFATDLHHLAISAIAGSYDAFRPGVIPDTGDAAQLALKTAAEAFRIGVQISAPFLVFGLVFNLGLGVLSRLMPQLQVFFIATPLTIAAGFLLLMLVLGLMMGVFLTDMGETLRSLSGR